MSDLENDARQLLQSLVDGIRTVNALRDEERRLISRWATKTAYVLSYPTPLDKPVDSTHLTFVYENTTKLPPGVGVFAQQHVPTGQFSFFQKNTWPIFSSTVGFMAESSFRPREGSYKVAMQFRSLLLLVAYWPPGIRTYALAVGLHVPLWPIERFYLSYYSREEGPKSHDSRIVLERFSSSLAICHRDSN